MQMTQALQSARQLNRRLQRSLIQQPKIGGVPLKLFLMYLDEDHRNIAVICSEEGSPGESSPVKTTKPARAQKPFIPPGENRVFYRVVCFKVACSGMNRSPTRDMRY